jgi:stage II sporulation protein D
MMRLRTALCVLIGLAACRPAGPGVTPPAGREAALGGREPRVRVGLVVDSSRTVASATSRFDVLQSGTNAPVFTLDSGTVVVITADDAGALIATSDGRSSQPSSSPLIIRPRGGSVLISARPYRGEALVRSRGPGRVTAMNVVELEQYLLGVVPEEIGRRPSNEIEAVKAQAIAARTYAVGNLNGRESLGFDFFASVMDQVYRGVATEDTVATRAVRETAGEIITYDGQPILAYYHSTCGGRTSPIEESWRNRPPQPYLRSVSDTIPGTQNTYCETSNRNRWTVSWTAEALRTVLSTSLRSYGVSTPIRRVEQIALTGRMPAGRADAVRIVADGRTYTVRSDSIRWVLAPDPAVPARILNSSLLFDVHQTTESGEVTNLEVRGGGWGHGIGMCQVGAMGRARAGQTYREILGAYYQGTRVSKLY